MRHGAALLKSRTIRKLLSRKMMSMRVCIPNVCRNFVCSKSSASSSPISVLPRYPLKRSASLRATVTVNLAMHLKGDADHNRAHQIRPEHDRCFSAIADHRNDRCEKACNGENKDRSLHAEQRSTKRSEFRVAPPYTAALRDERCKRKRNEQHERA